ncbi:MULTISPECIES: DUF4062 domain-containing protein [unclassified Psychrobacter]|uniref:DUF4062 domain-containing protein n=1 Tax=unclassified Psychrobacter TaxID=196806 RepID=UPI0018F560AF|nr:MULTISPECIES: DUF4062 domain-containing protein [unclassified Psychrobacter]
MHRYHIHVICAANDQLHLLEEIAIFFQTRAFLTYDVSSQIPTATLYSRQCIDTCDYTLVIIGDSYGMTHKIGVSQMHLSYLSAKAKMKPMMVLVKTQSSDLDISRQLQDFMRLVEQQANRVYYYDGATDMNELLSYAYDNMVEKHPALGWRQGAEPTTAETDTSNHPSQDARYNSIVSNTYNKDRRIDASVDSLTDSLGLNDTFIVEYTAQAYEGGNLSDVHMKVDFTWREILVALVHIPSAFSKYGLQNCINNLIAPKADIDIKKVMPNVHAVARCQITQEDLLKLQHCLIKANWIELTAPLNSRISKELWKVTYYAKQQYKDIKAQEAHSALTLRSR